MTPSKVAKKRQKVSTDRLEREPKETYLQPPLFARHVCHDPWRLLFALAFAAIGALFAYLLVHDFWTGQSQRTVLVATIYFGSFAVIGAQLRIFSEFGRLVATFRSSAAVHSRFF
jgi:hypothetical protein